MAHYGKGSDGMAGLHGAQPPPDVEPVELLERIGKLTWPEAIMLIAKELKKTNDRVETIARELGQIRLEQENFTRGR